MTVIFFTAQIEGWHFWASAPKWCAYLQSAHRHVFHIKVEIPVTHSDRQVEFITERSLFLNHFTGNLGRSVDPAPWSCEDICDEILKYFIHDRKLSPSLVSVSEDGENGATWYRDKQ